MKRTNPLRIVFVRNDHKITEMERKQENASLFPGAVYVGYGQHQQGLVCSRKTVSCKSVFVVCVCSELRWFEYIAKQASFRYPIVFVATCLAGMNSLESTGIIIL